MLPDFLNEGVAGTGFLLVQTKIKSFSPLYLLKIIVHIKKKLSFSADVTFLPTVHKNVVVLRSPFIYKSSRLKFRFSTSTAVINSRFFVPNQKQSVTGLLAKSYLSEL
jgi:hypothetical protein